MRNSCKTIERPHFLSHHHKRSTTRHVLLRSITFPEEKSKPEIRLGNHAQIVWPDHSPRMLPTTYTLTPKQVPLAQTTHTSPDRICIRALAQVEQKKSCLPSFSRSDSKKGKKRSWLYGGHRAISRDHTMGNLDASRGNDPCMDDRTGMGFWDQQVW